MRGHDAQFKALRSAIADVRLHHAWLLHGPSGIGKARFAGIVAARLLAEASSLPPEGNDFDLDQAHPTARLMAAGAHPDLVVLERQLNERTGNLARSITIDQVRALRGVFANTPSQGDRRVVIVDSIDDLERGGANALLKSLEEPPASTVFLLVSHAPGRLLPTIRSRCRSLAFSPLSQKVVEQVLAELRPLASPALRQSVAIASKGSPGRGLALLDAEAGALSPMLEALAASGDPDNRLRLDLATTLAGKAALPRYESFLTQAPAFIAARTRDLTAERLRAALDAYDAATALAGVAIAQSLPPESVVFELAGHVAALVGTEADVKG